MNLRLIVDVVYNHTLSSGPTDVNSVLDKSFQDTTIEEIFAATTRRPRAVTTPRANITCSTDSQIDDLIHWAKDYKVDGFRFDLMGHIMLKTMLKAKAKLEALTLEKDGVDGSKLYLYGEGWDYAEVVQNRWR